MSTVARPDHDQIRPEPPTTYYDGETEIPGFGDAPDRCRPYHPVGFCDAGHAILGRSSCQTRYCPEHWRDWIERATVQVVARLAAYRHVQEGADKRVSHVVASPPQDRRYSSRELWDGRSDAYGALKAAGLDGGAAIAHPYRTNERANNLFETAVEAGDVGEGTGRWRFLRDLADDWQDMGRYVEASPHYHALAAGADVEPDDAPDGWVVKRIDSLQPFHPRDTDCYRDMAKRVYYVLSHAGSQQGRQSTTYFGDVHPAGFQPEEELTTAMWDRIQTEAEKAVRDAPTEDPDESAGLTYGPDECPRDECDEPVHGLDALPEWLDDDDNVSALLFAKDGRKRWLRLRGLMLWSRGMTDRPPPAALVDEDRLLDWLEGQGQTITKEPKQVGLTSRVANGPPRWAG